MVKNVQGEAQQVAVHWLYVGSQWVISSLSAL